MLSRHNHLDLTWIALIALSVATLAVHFLLPSWLPARLPAAAVVDPLVLVLAAIKGRQIVLYYLDLKSAPALWRRLVTGWVVAVALFAWATSAIRVLI
ncbi:MAG: cytochrome C oxidase subunit IV family protein [Alphaproteobacteria bacterium]|nr:cytochrome C oxidase subunit IV family protein [Alphaproteobacteria bacterium]